MIDEPFGDEPAQIAERNLRVLEALLFASAEPLSLDEIAPYLGEGADVPQLLERLAVRFRGFKGAYRLAVRAGTRSATADATLAADGVITVVLA